MADWAHLVMLVVGLQLEGERVVVGHGDVMVAQGLVPVETSAHRHFIFLVCMYIICIYINVGPPIS